MALAYSNIAVEIREISLRDRPEELYRASNKGTVPVLITKDNAVIDESLDIMIWALRNNPNQSWMDTNPYKELEIIEINDTVFKGWLDKYKYHDRYPENSKLFYRDHCSNIIANYEVQLNSSQYLFNDKISIVDIAIFPFIRQFANVDHHWFQSNYKNLNCWLAKNCNSILFNSVMEKYDLWNPNKNKTIIKFNH